MNELDNERLKFFDIREECEYIIDVVYDKKKRIFLRSQLKLYKDLESLEGFKVFLEEETKSDFLLLKDEIGIVLARDLCRFEDAGRLFLINDFASLNEVLNQPDVRTIYYVNSILDRNETVELDKDDILEQLKSESIEDTLRRLEDLEWM